MNRRNCLKVFAAGVPLAIAQSAFAQDETLTGYLMSTGRDPSFAARKVLWSDYRPAEKYTGSAQQNIDFLKAIKTFDAAPQIELVKATCGPNEDVKVTVNATGSRTLVAKCMKEAGIKAGTVKKFRVTTIDSNHHCPVAENVVNREFVPSRKNQTWAADITYIPTQKGWLYLAAVEDLYSRKIVGSSMSDRIDSRLVVDALQMAIHRELPKAGLVAHSDRGVQYASEHY